MSFIKYGVALLFGAVLAFAVSVIAFRVIPLPVEQVPLQFVTDTFPQGLEVCPGETVEYNLGILEQVDGVVALYTTIDRAPDHPDVQSVTQTDLAQSLISQYGVGLVGDTVIPDFDPAWVILGGDNHAGDGLRVDVDGSLTIPELSPGPYIRKLAVVWEGRPSDAVIRFQRFTIKDDCK